VISQTEAARLIAAHEKCRLALLDVLHADGPKHMQRQGDRYHAAENKFAELVSELTMPEGE
jgi:hypothetical protein